MLAERVLENEWVLDQDVLVAENIVALIDGLPLLNPSLSSREIIKLGLRGKRFEVIEVSSIDMAGVITDEAREDELGKTIFGWNNNKVIYGQLSPIESAVFLEDDEIVYKPTNGYHRIQVFTRQGKLTIEAICLYGLTMAEVLDLRILNSNDKSVKFARVAQLMQKAWELTPFYQEDGITLLQAFSLVVQGTSGKKLGLTTQKVDDITQYVLTKSDVWGRTPATIHQDLVVIGHASPDLVSMVRQRGGGHGDGAGSWNAARLRKTTEVLPGDFDGQKIVYQAVVQKDLIAEQTGAFARAVSCFRDDEQFLGVISGRPDVMAAIVQLIPGSPDKWKDLFLVTEYHRLTQDEMKELCRLVSGYSDDEEMIAVLYKDPRKYFIANIEEEIEATETTVVVQESSVVEKRTNKGLHYKTSGTRLGPSDDGYINRRGIQSYMEEVDMLKKALELSNAMKGGSTDTVNWWRTCPELANDERRVFTYLFEDGLGYDEISTRLGIARNKVIKLIRSGVQRYVNSIADKINAHLDRTLFGPDETYIKK